MTAKGWTALVTGASRGIGRAIAEVLAEEGLDLALACRANRAAAEETAARCRSLGVGAEVFVADLAVPSAAQTLVAQASRTFGQIDMLVANAGVGSRRALLDADLADFEATLRTNLTGVFALTQAVIPGMLERRRGRIVLMSSIAARTGGVISAAYAASKGGIEGLMHFYAAQLAVHGVTANAIAPAFIDTDMLAGITLPPPETMPLGRMGAPVEVAEAVRMLLRSGFITGQTIHVNAGRVMT